tara:strand:+ start:2234 stop:2482 length:249 start_codon:yes stop_codon:yes gene_type:complete
MKSKAKLLGISLFGIFISSFLTALIMTYLYPFLYNFINSYTKRDKDIEIDYWNAYLLAASLGCISFIISSILFRNNVHLKYL